MNHAIIILGNAGTDGGYWYIGADGKLHHQPGWDPQLLRQLQAAIRIITEASHIKDAAQRSKFSAEAVHIARAEVGKLLETAGLAKGGAAVVVGA